MKNVVWEISKMIDRKREIEKRLRTMKYIEKTISSSYIFLSEDEERETNEYLSDLSDMEKELDILNDDIKYLEGLV